MGVGLILRGIPSLRSSKLSSPFPSLPFFSRLSCGADSAEALTSAGSNAEIRNRAPCERSRSKALSFLPSETKKKWSFEFFSLHFFVFARPTSAAVAARFAAASLSFCI